MRSLIKLLCDADYRTKHPERAELLDITIEGAMSINFDEYLPSK